MSSVIEKKQKVIAQREALGAYFEALLSEPQQEKTVPAIPFAEPVPEVTEPEVVIPQPVIALPEIPDVVVETEPQVAVESPTIALPEPVLELAQEVAEEPLAEGVPAWARAPFQALLFRVSGLTLAVPLSGLSGVLEWRDEAVTPMLGRIEWYLGLMSYRGRQVPVVDTALLVLPADKLAQMSGEESGRLGHVVFVEDGAWGLACDAVGDVIDLRHDEVKWRTSRSKRRWLAGTVLQQMCAIIDPPAFAEMLRTGIADLPESEESGH